MNRLIMEYLIHEGFKDAAERFRIEAGIQLPQNDPHSETTEAMERRIQVRFTDKVFYCEGRHQAQLLNYDFSR